ncbi:M23 family metallopeptidase [Ottowia sp. GY511]|uniref:Peptidoglycan DD-metalloendopeptidase family protein n=1 Tax=Ottowia flava TaxID=2675430 RepID=A0ABW4KPW8_9BURK|nr:M23 family metallopeptidase [Ottowia sp. GY511]TXK32922.1 M23 family metallopeptidase [Ottowia sp. GY511]
MKQELISTGLALADFVHRHPKRITAVIAALLLGGGGGAFAVASLAPTAPSEPLRLVSESVQSLQLGGQVDMLDTHRFTLYRSEQTRTSDTPEALLKRLGLADPAAAAFLRKDTIAQQALFGRGTAGRTVTAEATDRLELQTLRTHWVENDNDNNFKRLVVDKTADGFSVRVETAPLVATQRLTSGVIRGTLYAATDEANLPDSVTKQLTQIFESSVDFHRGLRRGDRFSIVYESLEADGETIRSGRILSAEMVNRGKTFQAIWFTEPGANKGAYYGFDGQSLRKAYLAAPMETTRMTSGFGMRDHPVLGYRREHRGVDYAAPTGSPVRTIGDGRVEFAGVQSGYGNVIYVKHRNAKDTTVYAHLSRIDVKTGDNVMQGERIGAVGQTGIATGPHLHFEFRVNNEPQDPTEILAEQRENVPVSPGGRAAFAKLSAGMKLQLSAASNISSSTFE